MANEFKVKKGLIVHGSGSTVLDIQGSQGQLFSITDDLTGTLFAVSDISGVPIFDVNADGTTTLDGNLTQTSGNISTSGTISTDLLELPSGAAGSTGINLGTHTHIYESSGLNIDSGTSTRPIYFKINGTNKLELDIYGNVKLNSTSTAPLLFSKSTYGDMDTDSFYRIKFQDQGGVYNDVGIGQTATGNLGFNITAGKDFLFNNGTSGNILTLNGTGATFGNGITLKQTAGYSQIESSTSSMFIKASDIQIQGALIPDADSSRNLGASNRYWENLYADNLYGDGSNLTNVTATSFAETDTLDSVTGRGATTTNNISVGKVTIGHSAFTAISLTRNSTNGSNIDFNNSGGILGRIGFLGDGTLAVTNSTIGTSNMFSVSASGFANFASTVKSTSGVLALGADVTLFRDGANILRTDDAFHANSNIYVGGAGKLYDRANNANYIELADTVNISTDTSIAGTVGLSNNKSVNWPGGSIRAEGSTLKLTATTLIDLQEDTQIQGGLDIKQTSDSDGLQIFGYDDRAAYSGNLYIDSAGNFQIRQTHGAGSGYMQIHAENYLELAASSLIYTQANFRIYDAGQLSLGSGGDYKIKYNATPDNLVIHTDDNKGITIDNVGNVTFTEDVVVAGKVTAQEFHTEFVSASIMYESGSTKFGDTSDDTHKFTGSLYIDEGDIHLDSGRYIKFYGNTSNNHSIGSVDANGTNSDDIRINSYHNVFIDLDSNNNNTDTTTFFQISQHSAASTLNTPFFKVRADGRVGINEDSPDSVLHVNTGTGTGNANTVLIDRAGSSDYSGISFATAGTIDWSIGQNSAGNFELFEDGQDAKTRMTVKVDGNVGIGAVNPVDKLHIQGGNLRLENGATSVTSLIPGGGGNSTLTFKGGNYNHNIYYETSWNDFRYARLKASYNTSESSFYLYKSNGSGGTAATTTISTGDSTFAGNISSQGLQIDGASLETYHDFQSKPIDTDSGLFTIGGHGMQNGYTRALSLWSSTDGVWNSWIGTNLRWDGTNFKRASDNGGQNWGNIAGIRFLGNSNTNGAAMQFIIDPPEQTNAPSGEQTIGVSLPSSMTALSINNDKSATFGGNITLSSNSSFVSSRKFIARDGNGTGLFADDASSGLSIADNGDATFSGNITVNNTITTPTDTNLSLSPNGTGHVYFGNAGNGMRLYHYSNANDGKYTTHDFNGNYFKLSTTATSGVKIGNPLYVSGNTDIEGGLTINGSLSRGAYTAASNYHTGADNIVLKGNSVGISSIFFESEKDGTNINHNSDFGFIQYHAYGTGTTGESNELIIGVSNDTDDHVILNAPNAEGFRVRVGSSETDYKIYHEGHVPTYSEISGTPTIPPAITDYVSAANGGTFSGALKITDAINTGSPILDLHNSTNGESVDIRFTDVAAGTTQFGNITYRHQDSKSYGSAAGFTIGSGEATTTILADGKLMYKEGIYSKPATGTGAGTRKDSNWDAAFTHSTSAHAPTDAEANVQSDWNATSGDALILNKPTIPAAITDYVSKANGGTFSGPLNITSIDDTKLVLRVASGDTNDWNYINFTGANGTRDAYFGTTNDGTPSWYRDDGATQLRLDSDKVYANKKLQVNGELEATSLDINGNADISGTLTLGTVLAAAEGGTGLSSISTLLNSNAFSNFAVTTADYDTVTTRGLYRFQGTANGAFGTSHTTGLTLTESSGNYGWQLVSNGSADNTEGLAYRYRGTSWGNWQTLITKTFGDGRYVLNNTAPNAPTNLVTSIVNDTINVTFTASTTTNIDNYLVFSSVAGGDYGLISVIPPADFGATMSIIDDSFNAGGTQAYRVYAVKNGVYSSPLTGTKSFSVGTVEPTNMSVINLNTAYYIQYDAPSAKGRFVTAYNIYKHEHDVQGSLDRTSATLIYSGMNNSYMYQISGNNNNKFHQFWVETTAV